MAQRLAHRHGADYLDTPVTGGTEGAKAGTLTVLCGGSDADLDRAMPVLATIGGSIHHFGAVGSGQQVKAVNQVLVAGSYAAVAEAIALGQHLQLPMQQVVDALRNGAAGSWALEHRSNAMLSDHYPLGWLALHHKDGHRSSLRSRASLDLPITQAVQAQEQTLMDAGLGDADVSALRRHLQGVMSGLELSAVVDHLHPLAHRDKAIGMHQQSSPDLRSRLKRSLHRLK